VVNPAQGLQIADWVEKGEWNRTVHKLGVAARQAEHCQNTKQSHHIVFVILLSSDVSKRYVVL
jgi:hypothetical protein